MSLTKVTNPMMETIEQDLALKANLASPALTGTPTAPTATAGTNTTQIATTEFVQSAVSGAAGSGSNPYIKYIQTGSYSYTTGGNHVILYNSPVTTDSGISYDTATGRITYASTGVYLITSAVVFTAPAVANANVFFGIYENGNTFHYHQFPKSTTGEPISCRITFPVNVTSTSTHHQVFIAHTLGSTVTGTLTSTGVVNFLVVTKI